MSKVPPLNFRREDIPDLSTGERTDRLLRGINAFGSAAQGALNQGLTFKANFKAFTKEITVRGGTAATPAATTDTAWVNVGSGGSAPAFENGFTNVGAPFNVTRFKIDSAQVVHVQIAVNVASGTRPLTIFTLPTGRRPAARIDFPGLVSGEYLAVLADGKAQLASGGASAYSFVATFPADDYSAPTGTAAVSQDWPIKVRNDLGAPPSHVWVTRLVGYEGDKEVPMVSSGLSWTADKDQVLVHSIGNVSPGSKFKATILVVAE